MDTAGGILQGFNGGVRYVNHTVSVGENAGTAGSIGGNVRIFDVCRALGGKYGSTYAVKAGIVTTGTVGGGTGNGAVGKDCRCLTGNADRIFIGSGGSIGLAGFGGIF